MRKVGIYTPYLDSMGGGERYMMTIAEILAKNFKVDVLLDSHLATQNIEKLKSELTSRFGLNLQNVNFIKAPLGKGSNFLERLYFLRKYYYLFYLTDGSIFYSTAMNNILHIQSPIQNNIYNFLNTIKQSCWKEIIYNSLFTKKWTEAGWNIPGVVLYPPVDVSKIVPLKKEKIILSVGRFNSFLRSKKHEVLIDTFSSLSKAKKMEGWSLYLAGSIEGDPEYLNQLKKRASGYRVKFFPDINFVDLIDLYGRATIYWHAAGFDEQEPAKMEHFGISTVEAMAGGCIPIVIDSGGQPEIVEDGISGYVWRDIEGLKSLTLKIIEGGVLAAKISEGAVIRSKLFSKQKFNHEIEEMVGLSNGKK